MSVKNHNVKFVKRPGSSPMTEDVFLYEECKYPEALKEDQVLVKSLYISVDPVNRFQMNEETGIPGLACWQIGDIPASLFGVGEVVESKNEQFKTGDIVVQSNGGVWPFQKYFAVDGKLLAVVKTPEPEYEIAYYGMPGLTALLALTKDGYVRENSEKVKSIVISGGAGSVGHLAGQIARLYGCQPVIGICGSDQKCNMLKNELNFTGAINYKTENVQERIKELCPNGVDFYYDNVGGSISDAVVANMNQGGFISVVGAISQYQQAEKHPEDFLNKQIKEKNIERKGFLLLVESASFAKGVDELYKLKHERGVKVWQHPYDGLENVGKAFCEMFEGKNVGKTMIKV